MNFMLIEFRNHWQK